MLKKNTLSMRIFPKLDFKSTGSKPNTVSFMLYYTLLLISKPV